MYELLQRLIDKWVKEQDDKMWGKLLGKDVSAPKIDLTPVQEGLLDEKFEAGNTDNSVPKVL